MVEESFLNENMLKSPKDDLNQCAKHLLASQITQQIIFCKILSYPRKISRLKNDETIRKRGTNFSKTESKMHKYFAQSNKNIELVKYAILLF